MTDRLPGAGLANDQGDEDWKTRTIWVCDCGSTMMYLHASGLVECGACSFEFEMCDEHAGKWLSRIPKPPPEEPAPLDGNCFKVSELQNMAQFLQKHLREDVAPLKEATSAVIIWRDGSLSCHRSEFFEAPDQRRWLLRALRKAFRRLAA